MPASPVDAEQDGAGPPSWLPIAGALAVVLLGVLVVAVLQWRSGGQEAGTFAVPTLEWDGVGGDGAQVAGTLWFGAAGCTLVERDGTTSAVVFPNATGVAYVNGARAVVDHEGRVYAVEGGDFDYAGGWAQPGDPAARVWQEACGDPGGETAYVQDEPAAERLRTAPPTPGEDGPTAPGG